MKNKLQMAITCLVTLTLLFVAALATASPEPLPYVTAALATVPVPKADRNGERAELRAKHQAEFAHAIAEVSAKRPDPRTYAALLMTIGERESHYDTDVVEGRCRPFFCDMIVVKGQQVFRAKGAFQNHDIKPVHDLWPDADGSPRTQVLMADRVLARSLTRCAPFAPFPQHVFRAYRGGGDGSCSLPLRDEAQRIATFNRLARVQVKP